MGICGHCSAIARKLLSDKEGIDVFGTSIKLHHQSYKDLETSALTCSLCELLIRRFRVLLLNNNWDETSSHFPEIWYSSRLLWNYDDQGKPTLFHGAGWEDSKSLNGFDFFCRGTFASIDLYTDEGASTRVSKDFLGRSVRSANNLAIAKSWIRTCLDYHSRCRSQFSDMGNLVRDQDFMPARVIDVGDPNGIAEPYLLDYSRSNGPYIALSHCWGELIIITTTTETLDQHKKQIPLNRMSKTFQDAIHITRSINVRYLWIDSLCIIQDDYQDWDRESPKMGYIYMNAIVNIAAASAKNGDGGCLTSQTLVKDISIPFDPDNSSVAGRVYVRNPLKHFGETVNDGPLNQRAWVEQERLLSRRTLHCTKDQLHWECHESCESEDGTVIIPANRTKSRLSFGNPSSFPLLERDSDSVYRRWYDVIADYSSQKMTQASDKLPAISGLASLVANYTGDQYLAGLWRKDLEYGLLWRASRADAPRLIRPSSWRAPSWAWAALDGGITFEARATVQEGRECHLDVLEASVELSGHNAYGMVSSGHLIVSGRLVQVEYEIRTESMDYFTSIAPSMQDLLYDKGEECGYARLDEAGMAGPLYCLEVFGNTEPLSLEHSKTEVLLLKATAETDVYFRVGIGTISSRLFTDKSNGRITIV